MKYIFFRYRFFVVSHNLLECLEFNYIIFDADPTDTALFITIGSFWISKSGFVFILSEKKPFKLN